MHIATTTSYIQQQQHPVYVGAAGGQHDLRVCTDWAGELSL